MEAWCTIFFLVFDITQLGIECRSSRLLANPLTIMSTGRMYIYRAISISKMIFHVSITEIYVE